MVNLPTFKPDLHSTGNEPLIAKINTRMKPGGCSSAGFMGANEDIVHVCRTDSSYISGKKITHEQIADRLEGVIAKIDYLKRRNPDPNLVAVIGGKVKCDTYLLTCGSQECPFSQNVADHDTWCGEGSAIINLTNLATGKKLVNVTELHPHLIRDHHFFEGNTSFRLDPEVLIDVLDIQPDVDYKVKTVSKKSWKAFSFRDLDPEELTAARKDNLGSYSSEGKEFEAHILPHFDWNAYKSRGLTHRERIVKDGNRENKTPHEIQEKITFFSSIFEDVNLDEQSWTHDGNNYLHVFCENPSFTEEKLLEVGGGVLSILDIKCPHMIFKLDERKIPLLDASDCVISKSKGN